jgi:hypothetical protein
LSEIEKLIVLSTMGGVTFASILKMDFQYMMT